MPEDATGDEAELRRNFFEETGIYLLFSDTLGARETPTLSGETASDWQIVDFFWNMNVGNAFPDSVVFFPYQGLSPKAAATEFLQEEVVGNLPELFHPYSILLLDRCIRFTNSYGIFDAGEEVSTFPGMQSTAVALGDVDALSPTERERLRTDIIGQVVISRINLIPDEAFAGFYSYSEGYYDITKWDVPTPVESCGFLDTYTLSWTVTFNTREYDRIAFAEKIFELTETEFRETYAAYPLVISKMEEMVRVLNEYGINIYNS